MSQIRTRLDELGLFIPDPMKLPPGIKLPFESVRVIGNQVFISGHIALEADGSLKGPFGKVGTEVTVEQAYEAAKFTALSILASLERELGDLDRITHWVKALGMVNGSLAFNQFPAVINGFSDLILTLYGEKGKHARSAVGMGGLPFNTPVEIEAQVIFIP